ncbi:MAG: polyprenyl synthetase family protein [Actinomycetota bacterium]
MSESQASLILARLRERIDSALASFLHDSSGYINSIGPELASVAEEMNSFLLDGGKRFRPLLSCIGAISVAGGDVDDATIKASASLELLHACALIHDDVMDGSDTRRGRPSVHRHFESLHRENSLSGDSAGYGVATAILLGDLALIWSDQILHRSGLSSEQLLGVLPIFDELRVELMAGQFLDVHEQSLATTDSERSLRVASYKSGKYSIERPLHFGAKISGGSDQLLVALSRYGMPIGEAFQLRDDILGVFGDPKETGKPAGDDLREGKRTVLIAFAHQGTSEAGRRELENLGNADLDANQVTRLREVITSSGAVTKVEEMISQRAERAQEALTLPLIAVEAKPLLELMAHLALVRRS